MAVRDKTSAQIAALVQTRAANTGFEYPEAGRQPYHEWLIREMAHIDEAANGSLLVKDENATMTIRVMPGEATLDGVALVYAGATVDLSAFNNDVAYVWLHDSGGGVAAINKGTDAAGWPTTAHVKLAEVTLSAGLITAIADRRARTAVSLWSTILTMHAYGTWAIDGDAAETNGGGIVGDVALTEAAAALAVVEDAGVFALLNVSAGQPGYTANYQLFPDSPASADYCYFGHTVPFAELAFDVLTAAVHSGDSLLWQYWDGDSWETLTLAQDNTNASTKTGTRAFTRDGAIHFIPPSDWATTTINSQLGYWVRCNAFTAGNLTTSPVLNGKEHEIVAPEDGFRVPFPGIVTDIRGIDAATGTLHTTADVKYFLHDFTSGAHSGELTWAQDKRQDAWASLTLNVAKDDVLGVVMTQEDGTNEIINGALELEIHPIV